MPPVFDNAALSRVVLVGGGVRSGKSSFALQRATELGHRRAFIATAQAFDDEMQRRIDAHREQRGRSFHTVEEPLDLVGALEALSDFDVVVVDCLTLWLSNLLLSGVDHQSGLRAFDDLSRALNRSAPNVVLVTNEVGMGIVPDTALGRTFRDLAGLLHQRLAREAREIYLGALGVVLRIRPAPVESVLTN